MQRCCGGKVNREEHDRQN
ncbi:hypothetical protein D030_1418A, partial [Vibrio parahaemolyticus AQ3810]